MCHKVYYRHKKCGHHGKLKVFCPLAPRDPTTKKPLGKFCRKSKEGEKVYKKRGKIQNVDWKCPKEECRDYERLGRYWKCCSCKKGPNWDTFCRQVVLRQRFESVRRRGASLGPSLGPRGTEERGKEEKRGSRRSVSMYWRTCAHLPCSKCTWFGRTIPVYDQGAGCWRKNGSGEGLKDVDVGSSQTLPEEYPEDLMTDTEFDLDLYDSEDGWEDKDGSSSEDEMDVDAEATQTTRGNDRRRAPGQRHQGAEGHQR